MLHKPAPARYGPVSGAVILMRPHQWVKNLVVGAPLFFTPDHMSWPAFGLVLAGIAVFSGLASGVYVLNDIADRKSDALHPEKRLRPLVTGTVPLALAMVLLAVLWLGAGTGAVLLGPDFLAVAAIYVGLNVAYSAGLKQVAIVDVLIIAFGYVLRLIAGAILIGVEASAWIVITTGLLALFLALAKRRDDFVRNLNADHRPSLKGYSKPFLDAALAMTLGAMLVAYLVYTTDARVTTRMGTDKIYYTAPFVVAGVLRYLQITLVEERSGSPTKIVLTDPFMIFAVAGWLATFAGLIYL